MSLRKQFETNTAKEVDGVAIEFGENDDGTRPTFWISRMSRANQQYTKTLETVTRPYRRQMDLGTLANDVAEKLFLEVFVKTILKGWDNVKLSDVTGDSNDEGFAPFNVENATKLMKGLPELYDDLQAQAKSAALFKDESIAAETKN